MIYFSFRICLYSFEIIHTLQYNETDIFKRINAHDYTDAKKKRVKKNSILPLELHAVHFRTIVL